MVLLPLALFAPGSAFAADDPLSLPATVTTLDNGMVLILLEDHRTDTVALHVTFGVGARDEAAGELGCAHLFEHLMFEGSRNVPVNKFDEWLTLAGGENNAYTSNDVTAYHMTFPSGALDVALFLESDRVGFLDAGLTQENLENQQKVVLQERNEGYAEPNGRDWDTLGKILYPPDHPYHHPVIGTVADIEGFQVDAVNSFWRRHYGPKNAVMAIVGNFDSAETLERVKYWFSDVPTDGGGEKRIPEAPIPKGTPGNALVEDDVEERTLYLAWPTVPHQHPDEPALDLLSSVLSNGRGTRLDDALYYEKPLTSALFTYTSNGDLSGEFYLAAASEKTKPKKLLQLLTDGIATIVETPPTVEEIERARRSQRSGWLDAMEVPEGKAELLVDCYRATGAADCMPAEWTKYAAVTPDDVVRVAQKYLLDAKPWTLTNVPRGDVKSALAGAQVVELP
jgi:zinc protease